ncbi:hypothetical protein [Photobacterium aquimaris]|uniref:Uncharacterized protein n=1 Tax=Photobacterium aquimaris TaxID=512643 RepID=A0A1Y6L0H9_9GAMM|nr:hypothetical protein [Photobacterium aquimaris]SMY16827.1 hypothetical protein PAQU9191_02067 [Photobacterium aquimaris]
MNIQLVKFLQWYSLVDDISGFLNEFWEDVVNLLIALSTIAAAIGTIIAAHATRKAAKSASEATDVSKMSVDIAAKSAEVWKKQMSLEIELKEAKELKVSLNTWHRCYLNKAYIPEETDFFIFVELLYQRIETGYKKDELELNLKNYIDRLNQDWMAFEAACDKASFVGHNFNHRVMLLRRHREHVNAVKVLIMHCSLPDKVNLIPQDKKISIVSTVYFNKNGETHPDMHTVHFVNNPYGDINDVDEKIKISFHDDLYNWWMGMNLIIEGEINRIKSEIKDV